MNTEEYNEQEDLDNNTPDESAEDPIAALERERDDWKDLAVRRTAEVENIRRRAALREDELQSRASEKMITKMLPVLDDLHAALSSSNTNDAEALRTGIEMIYAKAVRIFNEAGVDIIEGGVGEPFDVNVHEALMHAPSEVPEGHVVQVIQRGYQLGDKVLRHAKVITSAGSGDNA